MPPVPILPRPAAGQSLTSTRRSPPGPSARSRWLEAARQLTDKQIELFWDDRDGGFFFTSKDHEGLIARSKGPSDGALPSGNSVSAENLLGLSRQLKVPKYREQAEKTIAARAGVLKEYPQAFPRMFTVLARLREGEEKK